MLHIIQNHIYHIAHSSQTCSLLLITGSHYRVAVETQAIFSKCVDEGDQLWCFDILLGFCPKDELHQWFLGLYGEHTIPFLPSYAAAHRFCSVQIVWLWTRMVTCIPCFPTRQLQGSLLFFKRLANRLQGVEVYAWHIHVIWPILYEHIFDMSLNCNEHVPCTL